MFPFYQCFHYWYRHRKRSMVNTGSRDGDELLHREPERNDNWPSHTHLHYSFPLRTNLWSEYRGEYFPLRPRAKPGQRILRRFQLRPLRLEVVPGLATCQPRFALGIAQRLCLRHVDPHGVRVIGHPVDIARAPVGDDLRFDIPHDLLWIGIERVSIARPSTGKAKGDHIALVVGSDGADEWFIAPFPMDGLSIDERSKIQFEAGIPCAHPLEKIGSANTDTRHRRRRIATKEWLRRLHLTVIGNRREENGGCLVRDPHLNCAAAAPMRAMAAGVLPVLGKGHQHRKLILHQLDVRRASERTPGKMG